MPLYEYRCRKCDETFEVRQKFADEPVTVHETCGGDVERLISAPSFNFKGTGWYVTDYAKGGKSGSSSDGNSAEKSDSKPEASKTDKNDSKSESKTESKSESKGESKKESKTESKPAPAKSSSE